MVLKLDCRRTKSESGRRPLQKSRQAMRVAWARVILGGGEVVTNGHILDICEGAASRT